MAEQAGVTTELAKKLPVGARLGRRRHRIRRRSAAPAHEPPRGTVVMKSTVHGVVPSTPLPPS